MTLPETPDRTTLIREIQAALAGLGYDPGPADGAMGRRTRNAIRSFQGDRGLAVDGQPDRELLAALILLPEIAGRAALIRGIQQALAGLGYDPGPADGAMGRRTRNAIRSFQGASGLAADGRPDADLLVALLLAAGTGR